MSRKRYKRFGKRLKRTNTNSIRGSHHTKSFNRRYIDGIGIHPNLPKTYGKPPADKQNENCSNCRFMKQDGSCGHWNNAPVRSKYWCKTWRKKGENFNGNQ